MEKSLKNIIDSTIDKITEVLSPIKIILFGSAITNNFNTDSDIDFLIVVKNGTNKRKLTQEIYKNILSIGFATDIVLIDEYEFDEFKNFDGYAIKSIVETGQVIYG
ncbi:MAG: nucleotidyltransferase domain-containing protein [Ignavibacteria bacterium]|nr:MAG: nucleotidyltransferase domain-containing protein [Ignavibacteria bacterium]